MQQYSICLIGMPKSLHHKLSKNGAWQNLCESCRRNGTEIWFFNSRPFPTGPKLPHLELSVPVPAEA
jgi:hypothetical protein